jgi:hypothetical protein
MPVDSPLAERLGDPLVPDGIVGDTFGVDGVPEFPGVDAGLLVDGLHRGLFGGPGPSGGPRFPFASEGQDPGDRVIVEAGLGEVLVHAAVSAEEPSAVMILREEKLDVGPVIEGAGAPGVLRAFLGAGPPGVDEGHGAPRSS